jgi:hypothetical protein
MAKFKILKFPAKCPFPEKSSLTAFRIFDKDGDGESILKNLCSHCHGSPQEKLRWAFTAAWETMCYCIFGVYLVTGTKNPDISQEGTFRISK